ncbi:MAG: Diaminobutyrate-pyruvate aminotransferase (EC [uncultured Thiotrichaceae bacterium]|uniref:Diaminobutyrate-pyruvate aminotransferase (EC) n=1 Tax=uncultured Thiotrichaceae bacterium TaxID=298394 RepID=A0A6S6UBL4_9GAMM|nr:MAG: Diaminobutyrate-pyruvate aminotransferase (EC [uncultured Thiotrichaceae bacterium]
MVDSNDNQYIDFLAACGSLNYGHNDPDMSLSLKRHIDNNGITAGLDLYTSTKAEFLKSFNERILQPRKLNYRTQFTGPTGTNGVEAALKLARKVTGRHNVISFTNGFHGVTLGSLAATGNKYNRMGGNLSGVSRAPFEGYLDGGFDTADYLDQLLGDPSSGIEPPAAILFETVQGEGGLNAASPQWAQKIAEIAKRHGALLIIDDVQAGCGRTGSFFSFEPLGIEPDLVVLSKSISGYGLPMAIVLIKPEYDQWGPAEHNGTFRGNNHAFLTASVMLEKFWSDDSFSQEIAHKAEIVKHHLQRIAARVPGSMIKGRGMMQGVSVGNGKFASLVCCRAFEKGLIVETSGPHDEVIKVLAALTIPMNLLGRGLDIIEESALEIMQENGISRVVPISQPTPETIQKLPQRRHG